MGNAKTFNVPSIHEFSETMYRRPYSSILVPCANFLSLTV